MPDMPPPPSFLSAVTTTGRPCWWVVRPVGRDPGFVKDKTSYRDQDLFKRRTTFDPRPTAVQNTGRIAPDKLRAFLESLEKKSPNSIWVHHLQPPANEPSPVPTRERTPAEPEPVNLEELAIKCSRFLWKMNQVRWSRKCVVICVHYFIARCFMFFKEEKIELLFYHMYLLFMFIKLKKGRAERMWHLV